MNAHPPPPPPPPPAPPSGPFPLRIACDAPETRSLISLSLWPHRLLHVQSMTSYVRVGESTYNGITAPAYNIISYTWGNYIDRTGAEAPVHIRGVDWPIPPIQANHFSARSFEDALHRVAKGVEHCCDWVWVDIACIPQEHENESRMSRALRGEEIGNQIQIFHRAKEAFAWLSSFVLSDIIGEETIFTTVDQIVNQVNEGSTGFADVETAAAHLERLDEHSESLTTWIYKMLKHPYFHSLWCLQEMVLRRDAYVILDDGVLMINDGEDSSLCRLHRLQHDIFCLRVILGSDSMKFRMNQAEALVVSSSSRKRITGSSYQGKAEKIRQRLNDLLKSQERRGLDSLGSVMPHNAYSMAQFRRASKRYDRIYGIVQIYGVSCSPCPKGDDDDQILYCLEDEFGTKLIRKAPILSQLFIHSCSDEAPRRSWLITQKCKVEESLWKQFTSDYTIEHLFAKFEVKVDDTDTVENSLRNIDVHFVGKAWLLEDFVNSTIIETQSPPEIPNVFSPYMPGSVHKYLGLMLDYHISRTVLGEVIEYFKGHEEMLCAIDKLTQHFCPQADQRNPYQKNESTVNPLPKSGGLRVALLGSGSVIRNIPLFGYIGIVLAPVCRNTEDTSFFSPGDQRYQRIGLWKWSQCYVGEYSDKLHYSLAPSHLFECRIR